MIMQTSTPCFVPTAAALQELEAATAQPVDLLRNEGARSLLCSELSLAKRAWPSAAAQTFAVADGRRGRVASKRTKSAWRFVPVFAKTSRSCTRTVLD